MLKCIFGFRDFLSPWQLKKGCIKALGYVTLLIHSELSDLVIFTHVEDRDSG